MPENIFEDIKKDFPIFQNNTKFGKPFIYLDSSATSQKPKQVIEALLSFYQNYNSNIHRGLYDISEQATLKYEKTREKIAQLIGAGNCSEIIFTRNATESINIAAVSWGGENIKKGDNIVSTIMEHHSNFVPWQQICLKKGAEFRVAGIDNDGKLDLGRFFGLVNKKTKLVALAYVSNVLGTINPVEEIVKELKRRRSGAKIMVDAAQAIGHIPVNVQKLGCDFLAFSGHKMLGPDGVGVFWAKKEVLEKMPPMLSGGNTIKEVRVKKTIFGGVPAKFEAGTPPIGGVIALGAAADYLIAASVEKIKNYLEGLTAYALNQLSSIPGIEIYGPKNPKERSSLAAFNIKGAHPHDLAQILNQENIAIRAGHHCSMPLHSFLKIPASVRASFHIYNTKEDIDGLKQTLLGAQKLLLS